MRDAVLQLPEAGSVNERHEAVRAAVRQLERAELYLAAVAGMELGDRAAHRALNQLRADVEGLKRQLGDRATGFKP